MIRLSKKTSKTIYSHHGFTLIEALVVMSIIAILTATAVQGFRGYTRRVVLRDAAVQTRNALLEAQSLALSPRNIQARSYQVKFGPPGETSISFGIIEQPSGEGVGNPFEFTRGAYLKEYWADSIRFPSEVAIDFGTVTFKTPDQLSGISVTPSTPAGSSIKIVIGIKGFITETYSVILNKNTGQVILGK